MRIALVWDNFGPLHDDRLRACVDHFSGRADVLGVEINGKSDLYSWVNDREGSLPKVTLFEDQNLSDLSDWALFWKTLGCLREQRIGVVFLCHYERPGIALLAYVLRLLGKRVYVMGCSKFDDRPRWAVKEALKFFFLWPYQGALVGGSRTREYLSFLGLRRRPIATGYNTVSGSRIRSLAGAGVATVFEARHFVLVARLVTKKNIGAAIEAFARFTSIRPSSRRNLQICGDGPLEAELVALAARLGVADRVVFHGFLQSGELATVVANALALVLTSTEEQFGNVVPEALSLGVPLLISDVCGARYDLLQTGVNGFAIEPQNVDGLSRLMAMLDADEGLWARLCQGAEAMASSGDAARFAEGVEALAG